MARLDGKSPVLLGDISASNSFAGELPSGLIGPSRTNQAKARSLRFSRLPLLEIFADDEQVGCGGLPPVQARLDDSPADFGRRFVPEIGRRFENGPGRIQRSILLRGFNV